MKINTFIVIAKVQKILINNNDLVKFYQIPIVLLFLSRKDIYLHLKMPSNRVLNF